LWYVTDELAPLALKANEVNNNNTEHKMATPKDMVLALENQVLQNACNLLF